LSNLPLPHEANKLVEAFDVKARPDLVPHHLLQLIVDDVVDDEFGAKQVLIQLVRRHQHRGDLVRVNADLLHLGDVGLGRGSDAWFQVSWKVRTNSRSHHEKTLQARLTRKCITHFHLSRAHPDLKGRGKDLPLCRPQSCPTELSPHRAPQRQTQAC